jgi:hypothetical protein
LKKLFLFVLCAVAGSIGLYQGAAQQAGALPGPETPGTAGAPAALVAHIAAVTSSRSASPPLPVNTSAQHPNRTKVVRIYVGAGYFDIALAEKLRPKLAKGLASTNFNLAKAASGEVSVPAKVDNQNKVPPVSNL